MTWRARTMNADLLVPGDLLVAKDERVWMVSSVHPADTYPDPDREEAGVVIVRGVDIRKRAFDPGQPVTVLLAHGDQRAEPVTR